MWQQVIQSGIWVRWLIEYENEPSETIILDLERMLTLSPQKMSLKMDVVEKIIEIDFERGGGDDR